MELRFDTLNLEIKHVFRVAFSTKTVARNIYIEIEHDGIIGQGEAAPSQFYHEDSETVPKALKKIQGLLVHEPYAIQSLYDQIEANFDGNYAAKAAVNIALYDWVGKKLNIPVWKLLGIAGQNVKSITTYTIGLDSLDMLSQKIAEAVDFPVLKIKLGTVDDYRIIENIRKMTSKPIQVDANEGWTRDEALEKIRWLATQNVLLVEQPLLAHDLEGTRWLKERVSLPIIADESVKTTRDLPRLMNVFDGINVKLMKCGGLSEALRMIHVARTLGFSIMLGCFIESSLAITAAAQLAPLADFLDLDGHLLLKVDPFKGIQIRNGRIFLPELPGLGVVKR